jgi:hypothetical protein
VLKYLWLCFISLTVGATTFKVQPIEQQIRESDGLFQGNYLRSKSIELENGSVATQMIFKMTKETGLQSELFGMDEIIVHFPGGTVEGRTVKVDGVPEFIPGEKVMLFIRNVNNRYWGMNMGFGTFKVVNYGRQTILVNSVFPHHPQVGQVALEYFEKAVKEIKGSSLKIVQSQFYPTNPDQVSARSPASSTEESAEGQNRSVASKSEETENDGSQPLNMLWLIMLLGFTGGVFRLTRIKSIR